MPDAVSVALWGVVVAVVNPKTRELYNEVTDRPRVEGDLFIRK